MFRYGSPFFKLMTLVSNLILLNLIWLITSLPLFTIGASLSAMYFVTFQYATKQDDSVIRAYFRAFKQNFKQATLLWIPHGLIGLVFLAELYYLTNSETSTIVWVIFIILAVLFLVISGMIYPMLGRYENSTKAIVLNSMNLSIRNLFTMLCVVILNVVPWVLAFVFPDVFWKTSFLWAFGGFSLIAYINSLMLIRVFKKYEPADQTASEN